MALDEHRVTTMQTISTQTNRAAFRFFFANAGYILGRRAVCAHQLLKAEQWAKENDVTFTWSYDYDSEENGAEVCTAEKDCPLCGEPQVVASLCDIQGADTDYRRVVEAELALEAVNA